MEHIEVKKLIGENAMTLDDGEVLFRQIHELLVRGETVELDFEGVEIFATPFFNAGIGRLLADLKPEILKAHLKIQHLSALGDRVLRRVIENAKEYYSASPEHRQVIDNIVHENTATM